MDAKEIFEQWKQAALPEDLAEQMAELGGDEKWIEDAFGQDINFGTAGMRGLLEPGTNRINVFTVGRVTEGLARLIDENGKKPRSGAWLFPLTPATTHANWPPTLPAFWGLTAFTSTSLTTCVQRRNCPSLSAT